MSDSDSSAGGSPAPLRQQEAAPGVQQAQEGAVPGEEAPQDDNELDTSFFPAPPTYYKLYTAATLALDPATDAERRALEPPDIDLIVQGGSYSVFGETWPIEEVLPSLSEMGVRELFDPTAEERTQSLLTLLRTMLLTYTQLLSSLLSPPPSLAELKGQAEPATDPERLVDHVRLIGINMHHLVNELRPVQARETLKALMRSQIDLRRAKTAGIKAKCAELRATLASLKDDLSSASNAGGTETAMEVDQERIGGEKVQKSAKDKLRELVDDLE